MNAIEQSITPPGRINLHPKNMSIADLQAGFLRLVKVLYSAEETQERLKKSPNFRARHGQPWRVQVKSEEVLAVT